LALESQTEDKRVVVEGHNLERLERQLGSAPNLRPPENSIGFHFPG
jgi:hypothetical protein